MKIIDAHLHFRPDILGFEQIAKKVGHENTEEHLREVFLENNIQHAVVMGNGDPDPNNHNYPDFMSYAVGLDSSIFNKKPIEVLAAQVEENLKREQCVGIKLYPGYCANYIYEDIFDPFYKLAQKYKKPVAVHTGALSSRKSEGMLKYCHPLTLDEAASKHPKVTFVMCHFGNPFLADAAAVVANNKNVMVDLSGILEGKINVNEFIAENELYVNTIKMWLSYIGNYKRIMYGTDWPIVNIKEYIDFIKHIIPKKYHNDVFYKNAKRIYKLK